MNILYSQFLEAYMTGNVQVVKSGDLEADIFCLALVNQDSISAMEDQDASQPGNFLVNSCSADFYELQSQGIEVSSDNYTPGGVEILFTKSTGNFPGSADNYGDGLPRVFYNMNKTLIWGSDRSESAAVQFEVGAALIYRKSDGLLVSLYQFGEPRKVNGQFSLSWGATGRVFSVKSDVYDSGSGSSVQNIDMDLSTSSNNPISNAVITQALLNLGTRLGLKLKDSKNDDSDISTTEEAIYSEGGSLDELSSLAPETLSDLFDQVTSQE